MGFDKKRQRAIKQFLFLKKHAPKIRLAAEWKKKWQVLIATILSARSRDSKTIPVCEKLFSKYKSLSELSKASLEELEKIIKPINFYKTKAKRILDVAKLLRNKKIPSDFNELIKLPGVGRKTANVYLAVAESKNTIGVDTHVARISQKLGWTKHKTNKNGEIEEDLKLLFPKRYWREINYVLVRFGQAFGNSKKEDELLRKINKI